MPNKILVTQSSMPPIEEYVEEIRDIWESHWLTNMGVKHQELQIKLKQFLGIENIELLTNGHMALELSMQALNLRGEVITTPFTFASTTHAIVRNHLTPVFCDIDPVDYTMDSAKIEKLITDKTCAIVPVHVYGNVCNVEEIQRIANKYGLKVIYDAAHAFGVEIGGRGIGNFGDISMMSFHATKLYHTVEGGALMHGDMHLKKRIDLLKNFGIKNEEEVVMPGINGKLNEVQAAVGLIMLDYVEVERIKRKQLTKIYQQELAQVEGLTLMPVIGDVKANYQYFVIRIDKEKFGCSRDDVYDYFKEYNIFSRKYFHPLCSEYTCYRQLPSANAENLTVANHIGKQVLSMPLYGDLSENDVKKICSVLKSFQR